MQKMKPKIVPNRSRLIGILVFLFSLNAMAQEMEPVYLIFDSQSKTQTLDNLYEKKELRCIYFTFKSDKLNTSFDFVFDNFKLVDWIKQKGDTSFYAGKDLFEGKRCYDGAWFQKSFREEAHFMMNESIILYLVDIRDEKDGKFRVYKVAYLPPDVM